MPRSGYLFDNCFPVQHNFHIVSTSRLFFTEDVFPLNRAIMDTDNSHSSISKDTLKEDDATAPSPALETLEEKAAFEHILKMLLDRQGVEFSHYRQSTVLRRLKKNLELDPEARIIVS